MNEWKLPRLSAALGDLYENVEATAHRIEHEPCDGMTPYTGWRVVFHADEPDALIDAGLVTAQEMQAAKDLRTRFKPDECGRSRHIFDGSGSSRPYICLHIADTLPEDRTEERRVNTKKMQREVARLLKRAFALPRREARA